jgi:hypothetical protein
VQGFDLDGTLADVDYGHGVPNPAVLADAPVIATPPEPFVVITARPHATAAERDATTSWLKRHQPNCTGVHYIDAVGADAIALAKGAVIARLGLTDYTDNNRKVLSRLAGMDLAGARLWAMGTDGVRVVFHSSPVRALWQVDGVRVLRADGVLVATCSSEREARLLLERLVRAAVTPN